MRKSVRFISAAAVAAITIGVVGPTAASAAEIERPATAASATAVDTSSPETVELTTAEIAEFQRIAQEAAHEAGTGEDVPQMLSAASSAGKALITVLKKSPALLKGAIEAAKAGRAAFNSWMGKQNWAVKTAWWALSGGVQSWVFDEIVKLIH
ncbi:hypothetical protein [Kitasatospora sp. McL0602]|uniref:hypothetical protein n=1 Tax=Kitasatospora sp. McL0602 TaxID=3439530 RepID=UPI003F889DA3